ncbi:flagellar assembly peptidoglycan hydrolase FlgJ [Comamonas endophytica]|uniref:Peptidoglycan hydrolase FlgJ n=1 Tax=Comamonas endophytica TaxID=2949090 RepID=A0ABY6GF27_9BURK|nr:MULTISPECIES: flagellar assembly peptidoglycan hydrolase FlgJ [unclassified Acidovorax]MCD2512718.1 flagellar assembly peptidoglycan hydrolase FlgJ [Acidovorax sp. D4N7]UYG52930.1 flagellar assembly peptidoglycan hydrolase FlgJ [Acidovorax sp. 5MLIR]
MSMSLKSTVSMGTSNALAVDARSLNALKYQAGENNPAAVRETAKQLESLFMREMIKSMREATMKSGLLDGAQGDLGADLLDQQLSVTMSGQPGGLADAIARQLSRAMGGVTEDAGDDALPSTLSFAGRQGGFARYGGFVPGKSAGATSSVDAYAANAPSPKGLDNFVRSHAGAAERVAQASGIPAAYMLGQAGHETGWGKSEIRNADGSNSFNLFGIKAGKGWTGKVAEITTTEYIDGVPRKVTAKFRAYDSFEESFRDYAQLINGSARYEKARAQTGSALAYASELQKAGYATDPQYANKLNRAIQSTLRVQNTQA